MAGSPGAGAPPLTPRQREVILASSLGTALEWYDFYLYGSLAVIIARQFFAGAAPDAAFALAMMAFASGFLVRPFGAVLFGRLGDRVGRKYTFLVTIVVMGLATFSVGLLPTYHSIGVAAPMLLVLLRLLQGLALGGEYGGAAVFVAEHAPPGRRGACTAWVQASATVGLLLSLLVILGTRWILGEAAFAEWGWRLPFLLSVLLLGVSVWIRLSLHESPAFERIKSRGRTSRAPLAESFGRWGNLKLVLLALGGLTAGQAVVWYAGHFYPLFFLTQALKLDEVTSSLLVAAALVVGTPFFLLFGALSDRIGRKPIIMAGCLLAAVSYLPVFGVLAGAANPELVAAQARAPVVVHADGGQCSFQGSPWAREIDFHSSCDVARRFLARNAVSYGLVAGPPDALATVQVGTRSITAPAGVVANGRLDEESGRRIAAFRTEVGEALAAAGYPAGADRARLNAPLAVAMLAYLVILVAMVYAPIAAMLSELFPTRIRYTSLSLPYHVGNGWFGGLMPTAAFALVAHTGNMYGGLWYPVAIAATSFVIGVLFLRETKDVDMYARD